MRCVIAWSERRHLCSLVAAALAGVAGGENVRRAGEDACLVYSALSAADLRNATSALLADGESVLVLEFEAWSGFGPDVDREWLLAHGH